ncbi:Oidioi.mRNA.OKI2018_I69.chr1.g3141.t1.cds [Oikopleura dioica]|uniref:Oidioi.mRNA.OKI2018_I69.chr1.g3141.t1.cds n=1 Tax=Oikopleura dioica TaxID=34765 RepID=A0ABN7T2F9_OIKDI|nr:Oidioi.mRNA.OKI2018_I69.chr1.g3141.t1.cds [Oikopleura dioica]
MKDLEFEVKEKVLCYEPDKDKEKILYDATIVEIRKKSDSPGFQYMIHFKEWSKSFDRWVDKNLLLKVTPENKKIQRDLFIKIIKENGDRDGFKSVFL